MSLTRDEIEKAWSDFGVSSAGLNARELLMEELSSICPHPDRPGALDRHEGRRSLARELLGLLDRYADHGGRTQHSTGGSKREPVAYGSARSLRRIPELDATGRSERDREHAAGRPGR